MPLIPIISIVIVSFILIVFVTMYNDIVFLKNRIFQALSNIDVLLKQRNDEIGNLVKVVKNYTIYEQETLTKIINIRSGYSENMDVKEKSIYDEKITNEMKTLFALAEKYPELKANENFLNLQKRITTIENHIADRRENYNWSVTNYNTKIQQFPYTIISSLFKYNRYPLFRK